MKLKNVFEYGYTERDLTLEDFYKIQHDVPTFFYPEYNKFEFNMLYKKFKYRQKIDDILTIGEQTFLIFAKIFGCFGQEKNLDEAENDCLSLLKKVEDDKPRNLNNENIYYAWIKNWQMVNVVLGTIFAYKKEFVKATYHFLICGVLDDDRKALFLKNSYKKFIFFVMDQIKNITPQKANYSGCGFSYDTPMGGYNQKKKADLYSLNDSFIIQRMVGENGEVIAAFHDDSNAYKNITRGEFEYYKYSKCMNKTGTGFIYKYKTLIIDRAYNVYETNFYIDGTFEEIDQVTYRWKHLIKLLGKTGYDSYKKNKCKVADGFTIRRTAIKNFFYLEFIKSDGTKIKGV